MKTEHRLVPVTLDLVCAYATEFVHRKTEEASANMHLKFAPVTYLWS